jgi:hypothetical protein
MTKLIEIDPGIFAEDAEYKEQIIEEYKSNPYIEALPDICDKEEVIDRLTYYPVFNEGERMLDAKYRFHIIQRLFQFFQPLGIHLDLESKISRLIRQGYIARNPLSKQYTQELYEGSEMIRKKSIDCSASKTFSTTAYGLAIIGDSGMGKSVTVNRIMSMYPQVIVHSEYKKNLFSQYQITYLKIDCPHDGSIKGLCLDFLINIDNILGTNYYHSSRNASANVILPVICQVARRSGLGLLIIDEIQNISLLRSGGAEKMLNFFMTLINNIGVPVVMIGTNKAMSVLQSQFRQARRGIGQGTVFFERIKSKTEVSWKLFIEGLFEYQWVNKPCQLTQEISNTIYEESQGIFDIAIKLFVMCQVRAISTNKEEITPNLIKYIAKENLKLVKPMLDALKTGNINKIVQFEDIAPIDISEFINKQTNQLELNNKIREMQKVKLKNQQLDYNIKEEAVLKLIDLDITPEKAKKTVEVIIANTDFQNTNEIVKQAYSKIIAENSNKTEKIKKQKKTTEYTENDLRLIVEEGKKNKLSAYESMLNSGFIKPYLLKE